MLQSVRLHQVSYRCVPRSVHPPQAWTFRRFLLFYVHASDIDRRYFKNHAADARRVGRLAFWIAVSAVLMIVMCVSFAVICWRFASLDRINLGQLFVEIGLFASCRIAVSFAQVRSTPMVRDCVYRGLQMLTCRLVFCSYMYL